MDLTIMIFSLYFVKMLKISSWTIQDEHHSSFFTNESMSCCTDDDIAAFRQQKILIINIVRTEIS